MISQISETRQPFVRRHNQSCVYYGIRGNARSQYAFDKSCILEGAAGLGIATLEPTGALMNGAGLGAGGMPVLLGPMPQLLGGYQELSRLPSLLGDHGVTLLGRGGMPSLLGDANLDVLSGFFKQLSDHPNSTFYVSKTSSTGEGFDDFLFVLLSKQEFADINNALRAAGRPSLGTFALTAQDTNSFDNTSGSSDVDGRIGTDVDRSGKGASLMSTIKAASDALQAKIATGSAPAPVASGSMSTRAKVLLGLGAAVVLVGVATLALGKKSAALSGPVRRRRRRR